MSGGFDANVPARKPRTKIARVISELTAAPTAERSEGPAVADAGPASLAAPAARDVGGARRHRVLSATLVANRSDAAATPAAAAPAKTSTAAASPVSVGREQIARLRERLAASAHARTGAVEPKQTAAAVRETLDGLRGRLEAVTRERSEIAKMLDEARTALTRASADVQRERRAREGLEAQAEERRRIADDAVAEAEALAAERDQVLGELAEHRRLEGEQTSLLTQVEAALAERDAERERAARELAEARDLANLRAAEVADVAARLEEEAAGRARAEARCQELEAEIARLSAAHEALESIEATLAQPEGSRRRE
jgi:chromosome segregation ATPase